ncbi:MAG: hypothetical protein CMH61_02640 [Nanoarchaeota archaeon]|nr:hypothetical protein [Nanoarchaeota archaeon]|tara:strand:+ start:392 stop:757 length:366 start_codon:yes stop_codon:yes gene_type:complete
MKATMRITAPGIEKQFPLDAETIILTRDGVDITSTTLPKTRRAGLIHLLDDTITFDQVVFTYISRKHATLDWNINRYFITDLFSSYGCKVAHQRIPPAEQTPIPPGVVVELGKSCYFTLEY